MFVSMIDNIYLEPKGVALIRDRTGWLLATVTNKEETRKTFAQISGTGNLSNDADLFPYRKQPAKVIEQPDAAGNQVINIYMRWRFNHDTNIYYALSWYFDVTFEKAIDIYDKMSTLEEFEQLEFIDRAYTNWRNGVDD